MNSEEGTSLAKMAVTVLLVVLVIGAVVAVVYMAYSWFTSGTDKLGDQVNSLDSSAYSQYDDQKCTGTDVLTALKTYRDSDVSILIGNGATSDTDGYVVDAKDAKVANYCALVNGATAGKDASMPSTATVTLNDKGLWSVSGVTYDPATGMAERNTNFSPTQNKASDYKAFYVSQKANFYSNLVYDSEGEVCGIMFRRMGATN